MIYIDSNAVRYKSRENKRKTNWIDEKKINHCQCKFIKFYQVIFISVFAVSRKHQFDLFFCTEHEQCFKTFVTIDDYKNQNLKASLSTTLKAEWRQQTVIPKLHLLCWNKQWLSGCVQKLQQTSRSRLTRT